MPLTDKQLAKAVLARELVLFAAKSRIARSVAAQRGWVTRRIRQWEEAVAELETHKAAARKRADRDFLGLHGRVSREIEAAANELVAEDITPDEFRKRVRATLRGAYNPAAELGKKKARGMDVDLSKRDAAAANRERYDEHKFLEGFVEDIKGKYQELTPEMRAARIRWRAGMYADALVGEFNDSFAAHLPPETMVRWVMSIAEHCDTCKEEASKGWRTRAELTRVPGDGSTICKTNCRCYLETADGVESIPPVEARTIKQSGGIEE